MMTDLNNLHGSRFLGPYGYGHKNTLFTCFTQVKRGVFGISVIQMKKFKMYVTACKAVLQFSNF